MSKYPFRSASYTAQYPFFRWPRISDRASCALHPVSGTSPLLWAHPTPVSPGRGYLFPLSVEAITFGEAGLSDSSTALSARAVSSHPGKSIRFSGSLLPRWWQASPSSAGWPSCIGVTRSHPWRDSLALRLARSSHGASAAGLLPDAARLTTW